MLNCWDAALTDFLRGCTGELEPRTVQSYRYQLKPFARWASANEIPLAQFTARHMREWLAQRAEGGVSQKTRRNDAITINVFFKFCVQNDYLPKNPLYDYKIPRAPEPFVRMPSPDELRALLLAVKERWDPATNPPIKHTPARERRFFRLRDYAILAGLIETGCRAGELLALTLDDYRPDRREIAIRQSKGDAPRIVPITDHWIACVAAWRKARPNVDCDRLFINQFGGPMEVTQVGRSFRHYRDFAGLEGFSLHGLRHYAITQIAKVDVLAASDIAGHKDLKITRAYLHRDADHNREKHALANTLGKVLQHRRSGASRPRKKVI